MRYFLFIFVTIRFMGCSEVVDFRDSDLAGALEVAKQSNRKVLIDFWADG